MVKILLTTSVPQPIWYIAQADNILTVTLQLVLTRKHALQPEGRACLGSGIPSFGMANVGDGKVACRGVPGWSNTWIARSAALTHLLAHVAVSAHCVESCVSA